MIGRDRTGERDALVAAIVASPGDLALRDVLADALTDAGDPRGELIRLQCARARAGLGAPESTAAAAAERDALARCEAALQREVGEATFSLRCGFIDRLRCTVAQLGAAIASGVFARHPVRALVIEISSASDVRRLDALAIPARVEEIALAGRPWRARAIVVDLGASSLVTRTGAWALSRFEAPDRSWIAAIRAMTVGALHLDQCVYRDAALAALAEPEAAPRLHTLAITKYEHVDRTTDAQAASWRAIGARAGLAKVTLSRFRLEDHALRIPALFAETALRDFGSDDDEADAIAELVVAQPRARGLEALRLRLGPAALVATLAALPQLRTIGANLSASDLGDDADRVGRALASSRVTRVCCMQVAAAVAARAPGIEFVWESGDGLERAMVDER